MDRIALLKKYISEEPDNPFNRYALAMELYEHQPDEASKLLAGLIRDHPDYLPTYFKLAHLYWEHQNWDHAENTFRDGILLAEKQQDQKTLAELKSALQNFQFDKD